MIIQFLHSIKSLQLSIRLLQSTTYTLAFICISIVLFSQTDKSNSMSAAVQSLELRSIGPALMGGRIADIAIHPGNSSTWYVAAGSGNLWKTSNSGVTWEAVFDKQASYSIGCVSIDPNNPEVIWVGTGENVSGRHVGWGDGIYRSTNGGRSWENMGLKHSEHISKILIDPRNSDRIFVAAEGPLWSSGGDRGAYKSTDGGKTWDAVLQIDKDTGVTDLEFDPSNPDIIYAAAYQRRRHIWSLLGGGPQSGIYKSIDNGDSWYQVKNGLPKGDVGKIGLGVTPADATVVYATIEADDTEKGLYKSSDRGESWTKGSSYISGGTGPHYYQEIEVSPEDPNLIYQMDVFIHVSRDGGKRFDYLGNGREKHSDNHALWIDPNNGSHLLAGTDAGLYESFDEGLHWRHFPNMPISQFYKLGLDNAEPFYNIIGGAQDLGTLIGPSRTMNVEGIRNRDWYVPLGADGYDSHFDPEDPNIAYMEIQQGLLHRFDRKSNEVINIQPQPGLNDPPERWNWDSPVLISPHNSHRLYFGSQRVWRSEDQGDSWTPVSKDLTTNTNRYELEMIGRVWSSDALYDNGAMSKYATLTSISESPITEGLLYTGSDDGVIFSSGNGGEDWQKSSPLPKVPARSFINDIEASLHHANTVFAVADAHKIGDYKPYMFISSDRGKSWKSIVGDLPQGTIVWVIKQDHINENLLFIGTEYGIYFSYNKGTNWIKLEAGVPTISFRDLELHQRDSDLVGASFGRGFYVLDDYSILRDLSNVLAEKENTVLAVRDAWSYIPSVPMQAKGMPTLGSTSYVADNPPFGAIIPYYVGHAATNAKSKRKSEEENLNKRKSSILFPGWETLEAEFTEDEPQILLLIKDEAGNPIRWLEGQNKNGLHRTQWDLRLPAPQPINLRTPGFKPPWVSDPVGPMVAPGNYTVELFLEQNGDLIPQGNVQTFSVKSVRGQGKEIDYQAVAKFQKKTSALLQEVTGVRRQLSEANERLTYLDVALTRTPNATQDHFKKFREMKQSLADLNKQLSGNPIRQKFNESTKPSINSRVGQVAYGHWNTQQMPTETFKENLNLAQVEFHKLKPAVQSFFEDLEIFESNLKAAGAPHTKGSKF